MKGQSRRISGTEAVLLSGLGLICATDAHAQTADPAAGVAPQLQQVVVTGTLIPTNPDAVAVPVTSLDASSLAATGVSNDMLASLEKTVPAFAGRSNAGSSNAQNHNQFTAGGSQIELRNLPTLVLLNGQRLALDAVAGLTGSKDFVDVSQIPAAALRAGRRAHRWRLLALRLGRHRRRGEFHPQTRLSRRHSGHALWRRGWRLQRPLGVRHGGRRCGPGQHHGDRELREDDASLGGHPRLQQPEAIGVTPGTALPGVVAGGSYALSPGLLYPPVPTGSAATATSYAAAAGRLLSDQPVAAVRAHSTSPSISCSCSSRSTGTSSPTSPRGRSSAAARSSSATCSSRRTR